MRTFFRSLLPALTLISCSQFVFAEDYYWKLNGSNEVITDVIAHCKSLAVPGSTGYHSHFFNSPTDFRCQLQRLSDGALGGYLNLYSRFGNSCPPGHTYNSETGKCDAPPPDPDKCEPTKGERNYNLSYAGPRSDFPAGTPASPKNKRMCDGSCAYEYAGDGTNTKCGSLTGGDSSALYCVFTYVGVGAACLPSDEPSNSNAPPNPDPPADPNDPTDPRNNCGPDHAWSGTTCVPYLDPDGDTPPTDPSPGDGGSDPGTGGGGGGGNGGGGNGGGNGSDPGTGGGGGGGGGGTDPGDADGSGLENGLEQKKQGDFKEAYDEWDEKIADIKAKLDERSDQLTSTFKGVFDLNLGAGSGSLPCDPLTITIGNSSATANSCIADYDDQLVWLRYIFLLCCAVLAAFIILRD